MQIISRLCLLISLLLLVSSCQMSRQLQVHKTELQRLAFEEMEYREKFDGLAEVLVTALEEAAARPGPLGTVRYVQKFSRQNQRSLNRLGSDLNTWIQEMKPAQRVAFVTRALGKPYSRKLIVLVPRIQQKAKEGGYQLGALERVFVLYKLKQLTRKK